MTMARRVDVGRQVRLCRSKPTMLKTKDGSDVEVEGNCDGVVIRGIDSKLWLIRWLNGTPNGLEAMATSRMISLVLPDDPPSTSGSSKSKPKSTPPSRGATNQANSKKKSKKKKESEIVFPTAEAWLNAYASDSLTIHPQGYIEDPSEDEENVGAVNANASSSDLGNGKDGNNDDRNGNDNDGSDEDDNNNDKDDDDDDNGDNNHDENGENMDAEELEEDNHPNLDLPPLDEPVDESCSKYRLKKAKYEKEKAELLESGYQVSCKDGRVWKAVENSISEKESEDPEHLGVQGYEFNRLLWH